MRKEISVEREEKIRQVLSLRQRDLTLVLDNIHDPHNVAAILRSCDAFGVSEVHLHYTREAFPALSRRSSGSAMKWVDLVRHGDTRAMFRDLKDAGYHIIGAAPGEAARPLPEWDLTGPTAIVLGSEHFGMEREVEELVEDRLSIPMLGMVQSLNVSVAAAVILYEAWRQRRAKGMYDQPSFGAEELRERMESWRQR